MNTEWIKLNNWITYNSLIERIRNKRINKWLSDWRSEWMQEKKKEKMQLQELKKKKYLMPEWEKETNDGKNKNKIMKKIKRHKWEKERKKK